MGSESFGVVGFDLGPPSVITTFKFGYPHLTLNEGPKVNSIHTRRFPAHDFLFGLVSSFDLLPSQTSRTNNKQVINTFKFDYPRLTLKDGPEVKSNHAKRFPAHDFLLVGLLSQTSTTNNKRVIIIIIIILYLYSAQYLPKALLSLVSSFDLEGRAQGQI